MDTKKKLYKKKLTASLFVKASSMSQAQLQVMFSNTNSKRASPIVFHNEGYPGIMWTQQLKQRDRRGKLSRIAFFLGYCSSSMDPKNKSTLETGAEEGTRTMRE